MECFSSHHGTGNINGLIVNGPLATSPAKEEDDETDDKNSTECSTDRTADNCAIRFTSFLLAG